MYGQVCTYADLIVLIDESVTKRLNKNGGDIDLCRITLILIFSFLLLPFMIRVAFLIN